MLLLSLVIVLVGVAVAMLMIQGPFSGIALFLSVFGLMWITALLLPPVASSVAAALGVFILIWARTMRVRQVEVWQLVIGLACAAVTFHFSLALLDLAMSTREFSSDKALILAALERGASVASLGPTAALVAGIALGALAGALAAIQNLRYRQVTRSGEPR